MRACLLCLEGAPRVRVHACACVLWCFCPRLAQGPGGRCLQTGGLLLGRPEGPRGQRGVGGDACGKPDGWALHFRQGLGSGWHDRHSLGTGSLSAWGGCTLDSQCGLREPCVQDWLVLAAWSWWARPWQVTYLQSGQQRVLSGRACLHLCLCPNLGHVCACGLLLSWGLAFS